MKKDIRQQFNEAVIIALHPDCKTYEEAINKEVSFGCKVKYTNGQGLDFDTIIGVEENFISFGNKGKYQHEFVNHNNSFEEIEIFGLPITIDRIAVAIKDKHYLIDNWRLGKNGEAGTFEDQTEEMQEWILNNYKKPLANRRTF